MSERDRGYVIPEEGSGDEDEEMTAEEKIAETFFTCHTCMEVLHEAIVFGCGHIMCVKCTNNWIAVKPIQNPVCPVCKISYSHLPRKCELIGTLIQKLKPLADETKQAGKNLKTTKQAGLKVEVEDVMCCSCRKMLYNPSVLNCGHVFCISCLDPTNEAATKCKSCGALHVSAPRICLDLRGFLEMYFRSEYRSRAEQLQQYTCTSNICDAAKSSEPHTQGIKLLKTHVGVGCDLCGVYPIQGKRYHCMTCSDIDICEQCSKIECTLKGRSGEVHSADHVLELDDSFLFKNVLAVLDEIEDAEWVAGVVEGEAEEDEDGGEEAEGEAEEEEDGGEEAPGWHEGLGGINAGFWWQQ